MFCFLVTRWLNAMEVISLASRGSSICKVHTTLLTSRKFTLVIDRNSPH